MYMYGSGEKKYYKSELLEHDGSGDHCSVIQDEFKDVGACDLYHTRIGMGLY